LKKIVIGSFLLSTLAFSEVELKSYLGYEYKSYLKTKGDSKDYNSAITLQSELKYFFDGSKIYAKLDALKDDREEQRDHLNLTELYYSKSFDDFDLDIGKKVVFLGSLEAYNLVDIINRQNYQKDSMATHKKGSYMVNLNYFLENESIFRFYLKGFEEDIKLSSKTSPYYPFGNLDYTKDLKFTNGDEKPSLLATYTSSYDDEIIADISVGVFYGYDDNILFKNENSTLTPYLFQSAKLFTYDTFVIDSTLFKVEASYTKVMDDGEFNIDDFYNLGLGAEYTIEQIYQNHNLGFITEYYKSDYKNTSFDNDIFLALRYSLNDKDSSEFLGGVIKDIKTSDKSAYIKYSGRLTDTLNVSTDLRYSKSESYLGEHVRFGCELKYYF